MAEANTDVRSLRGDETAEQLLGVMKPGNVIVGGDAAGRADPSVALIHAVGKTSFVQVVSNQFNPVGGQDRTEQFRVIPGDVLTQRVDVADHEQTDTQRVHRKENTVVSAFSRGASMMRSRRIGMTPSPNRYASSRCG
jgi:hypothetical protein